MGGISMITALAGGVGAARFLQGLVKIVPPEELTIIANTGDDISLYGLHISPDLDILTYTLAGIIDERKGWGIDGDTFHCLRNLEKYGWATWFQVGDRDMATHLYRTYRLKEGANLAEITDEICQSLKLQVKILPMSNQQVQTMIKTDKGLLHFQEYLVQRGMKDTVQAVHFKGIEKAKPAPGVIESIQHAERIIICPSNPIVSIGSIISLQGIKKALIKADAKIVGISPIIQGAPVKGPADKLLKGLNYEVSSFSVAEIYQPFMDIFIIDIKDENEEARIQNLGIKTIKTDTLMTTLQNKIDLAKVALSV